MARKLSNEMCDIVCDMVGEASNKVSNVSRTGCSILLFTVLMFAVSTACLAVLASTAY